MENNFYTKKPTKIFLRFVFVSIFILLCSIVTKTHAQNVQVSGTTPVSGPTLYPTLKDAFDAINLGTHKGVVTVNIVGNTTETATATLNASAGASSYTALNIQPSGGVPRSISGSFAGNLINLSGADNVTIDGLNAGGNSLTITNSNTGVFSTIRYINDASSNLITRCNLQGSGTGASGVVFLTTGTTTGNDNNVISLNNIGPAGANLPARGILSSGSTTNATIANSGGLIDGNNIFDYFSATAASDGINIAGGNNLWTVSNNRLYQTANRIYTTGGLIPTGITVGAGDGNIVSGNIVGFANSSGTGTTNMLGISSGAITGTFPSAYTIGTAVGNTLTYRGISCVGTVGGAVTKVFNNTVAGFAMLSGSGAVSYAPAALAAQRGVFCGISISTGSFDCGGDGANIIGSTTGTGSIYLANTVTGGGAIVGIFVFLSSGSTYQVLNNQIGALDATGTNSGGTISGSITGIQTNTNLADFNIKNNTIGNSTNPNLRIGTFTSGGLLSNSGGATFGTSTGTGTFHGIWNTSAVGTGTFAANIGESGKANIIQNAFVNSTNIAAHYKGIECSRYNLSNQASPINAKIEYNTIRFLASKSASVTRTGLPTAFESNFGGIGIYVAGGSSTVISNITGNDISDLSVTNTGTGGYNVAGIVAQIPFNNAIQIDKNKICRLSNASTSASATAPGTVSGIFLGDLNANTGIVTNNMISLGNSETTNTSFVGIWAGDATSSLSLLEVYHNTVNIEGTATSGAQSSFDFYRGNFSGTALNVYSIDALNNIFVNARTGGTGRHFAIGDNFNAAATSSGWGVNASDYNILNANPSTVGYWNGDKTFAAWKTASASDGHSFSGVTVTFVGPCDLHLHSSMSAPNFVESQGNLLAAVPNDIDNQARPGPAGSVNGGAIAGQSDLGADEFDGGVIFAPTITMISPATASICGLTSHLVKADITPNTGSLTSVILFWNNGNTSSSVAMTNTSGIRYEATIPSATFTHIVTWRIEAMNSSGVTKTFNGTPYTDPMPPASPTVTNYSVCNGTVPPGQGLTATCLTGGTNVITFNITQPTADETATGTQGATSVCPGNSVIGSFVIPPLAQGATITSAKLTITGLKLRSLGNSTSYGSEVEMSFSGSGIVGGGPTSCFDGSTSESSPVITNYVTGSGFSPGDVATIIELLNPSGGTITVTYNEQYNDIPSESDVIFPPTATFTIVTTIPASTVNWYNTPSGPINSGLESSNNPFDPLVGGPLSTGVYPYYARCIAGQCQSTVGALANFYVNQPLAASITSALSGNVCEGIENQLTTTTTGGGEPFSYSWSPSAGLSNPTIANPIATPSSTTNYTLTITDACGTIKKTTINLSIIPSPIVSVSPKSAKICRATDGPISITASGADFYAWSPASGLNSTTGASVNAFPTGNTSYEVIGTFINGCTGTDIANISADDKPLITAIATPSAVCASPNSTQLSVSTNPVYCTINEEGQSGGFINITFNTLNSFPFFPAIHQYNSHAAVGNETTTVSAGSTYNLFASTVVNVQNITSVWIDYNHDGDYTIDEWRNIATGASTGSIAIAIPSTAINGLTGMRFRQRNFANDAFSACIPWQSGSTEDYTIRIINGVNQPPLQTYSWSPAGNLNNATSGTPIASNLVANTTYTVTVSNFVGCTNTASVTVSASPLTTAPTAVQTQEYCTNTNNSNAGTVYISNVTLGSGPALINNTTTVSGQQFGVYTLPNPGLMAGTTYPISVSTKGAALGIAIWVDYNQSGTFDFFELQYSDYTGNLDETYISNIVVPNTAFNGQTRMRIRTLEGHDPTDGYLGFDAGTAACAGFALPGQAFDDGETEDYFLIITDGITHANPCSGAKFQLEANVSGGGSPYKYAWAPTIGLSAVSFSSPTVVISQALSNLPPSGTTIYTVTITDACGNVKRGFVPIVLSPPPVVLVEYDNGHGGICASGNVTIIASGADFYTWSPSTGIDNTDQDAVLATPTQTTFYVVTGYQGGCTSTASAPVVVSNPLIFDATADATQGCNPHSTQLHAGISSVGLVFTEITLIRNGTGGTPAYPFYVGAGGAAIDFVEISNASNTSIDISGYTFDDYLTTSIISNHPFTFPSGTIIPGFGVLVLHLGDDVGGGTADNPANRYFNTGGQADQYLSTSQVGFVLKNGSTVVDAVGCANGYVFAAGTGVTAADWTGFAPTVANTAGVVRNIITDNNDGGDWFASNLVTQSIGTYTPGMISITSYSWAPSTGLSSTSVENPLITNLTSNTTYTVTVTNVYGCTGSSTVSIFVNPTPTDPTITPGGTTTFCSGSSIPLTASSANASPTYTWAPAAGLDFTIGTSVTASPTVTTTYTLTVTIPGGCTATSTITININTANAPSITPPGSPSFCTPGSVLLNASAPGPYTNYSWSLGTSVVSTGSATYLATAGGTYVVTVTAPNTCTTTASVTVIANAPPSTPVATLVGTIPICDNAASSVVIDIPTVAGLTYSWNDGFATSTEDITIYGDNIDILGSGIGSFDFHVIVTDVNGCTATSNDVTVTTMPCGILFNMKMYIQGFYKTSTGFMDGDPLIYPGSGCLNILFQNGMSANSDPEDVDTVNVTLMDEFALTAVETQRGILKRNGDLSVTFSGPAVSGTNYWIQLKHRNLLETWSKGPVYFASLTTYDFTTASTQAYDEGQTPMFEVDPGVWAIFNGDINQSGDITSLDMTDEENDANANLFGYQSSDLDGDLGSTSLDMTLIENNSFLNAYLQDPIP